MNEPTFFTHTPLYYQPGTQTDYGIVQRIERVANTSLYSGGSVPCFAVYCQSAQQSVQPTAYGASLRTRFGYWLIRLGSRLAKIGGG